MDIQIKVTEVFEAGDDLIIVKGTKDGQEIEARGWFSALTNHFGPSVPGRVEGDVHEPNVDRHQELRDGTEELAGIRGAIVTAPPRPREMTGAEKLDYCRQLLAEQNPDEPRPLGISDEG